MLANTVDEGGPPLHSDDSTLGYFKDILLITQTFTGEMFWMQDFYTIRSEDSVVSRLLSLK